MTGRDVILGRIREALSGGPVRKRAQGGWGRKVFRRVAAGEDDFSGREWLPPCGETFAERSELFAKNSENLKTVYRVFETEEAMREAVLFLARGEGWKRVAFHGDAFLVGVAEAMAGEGVECLDVSGGIDKLALEGCDAGLTTCECLVAQTGTVLVSSTGCGGRALSVLPPHHVVLARREQMVGDLVEALRVVSVRYGSDFPTMFSFITGPSRTGDIERILVLGAHGPRKLTVYLLDDCVC